METKLENVLWSEYEELNKAINNWDGDVRDPLFVELQKRKSEVLNNLNTINKLSNDNSLSIKKINAEKDIKRYEQSQENKRSIIKGICMGALGILSLGITIWQTNRAFDFDRTSTFTSTIGKGSVNDATKVNPNKFFKLF